MKVIVGLGLIMIGAVAALCSGLAGFVGGVAIMLWSNDQKEKVGAAGKTQGTPVRYSSVHVHNSPRQEAPSLSLARKEELDAATPEEPVTLELEDIYALNFRAVADGLRIGYYKLAEGACGT